ncbi:phosphotransferase [Streptomyces sp. ME02-8801-2C]|uniref:phosphotransferase family protein n=1 Tax=Streptomyces sp. ME02-8801-2C TaxID=3028680 RepID=UPI0029A904AF|nr:phosphotransferase [Streptomyces sp. ME02-8801-2C]MDX3458173.1 phosphotransferase [Streptomyces sp. ME02-8801-2C]
MTATPRRELTAPDLAPLARAALGRDRSLTGVTRVRGGSKKGVYRLALDDGATAVAYVWSPDEDLWDAGPVDHRDPLAHATGLDLFTASHDRLTAVGVRTPGLLYADPTHTHLPADAAVVEDVRGHPGGGNLEVLLERDPETGARVLDRLGGLLGVLHSATGPRLGKVGLVDRGGTSQGSSCERIITDRALHDLDDLVVRQPRAAALHAELAALVRHLVAEVRPRTGPLPLIHGELGPDHVLVTPDGEPALIDIEGLLYFDAEWEHVFLRQRFGTLYESLAASASASAPALDPDRLRLYRLAMHLSLATGPLRLLEVGAFPDPAFMRGIAEHSLDQLIGILMSPRNS